jgi:beta-lactamase regulating signal transducer with metallopeptidase domain
MIKLVDIGIIVLSSGIFLLCYLLFLRKEKYYQLNRFYLLFTLMFSSLLPFLRFRLPVQATSVSYVVNRTTVTEPSSIHVGWIIYLLGVALFFLLFVLNLVKVLRQVVGKQHVEINCLKVINQPGQKVPFSFFRYVVLDSSFFNACELDLVLRHEAAHARQMHTLDLLFVEIIGIVCWFNPFVWAYKSALKSLHEFAADAAVLNSNAPRNDYFDLILKQIRNQNRFVPVHSFSARAVKSRLRMMVETRGGHHRWLRYLSAIPVLVLLVVGNSLLASAKYVPPFMDNVIVPAVDSQPLSEHSDKTDTIPTKRVEAKRVVRQTKVSPKPTEEDVPQSNVLESQSWLSTQYGDPVEIYEEKPVSKSEEIYFVRTTGDAPEIYRVNTCKIP